MIAFIDSQGQVKAVYTHDTTSKVWEEQGFTRIEVPDEIASEVRRKGRDCKIVGGRVADSPDPSPPIPPPPVKSKIDILEERIAALEARTR